MGPCGSPVQADRRQERALHEWEHRQAVRHLQVEQAHEGGRVQARVVAGLPRRVRASWAALCRHGEAESCAWLE
jgi:hypothetical protein